MSDVAEKLWEEAAARYPMPERSDHKNAHGMVSGVLFVQGKRTGWIDAHLEAVTPDE